MIAYAFEENIFPLHRKEIPQNEKWAEEEKAKNTLSEFNKQVVEKEKKINKELFKKSFEFQGLIDVQ